MNIDDDLVLKLENLAKIYLSKDEKAGIKMELSKITDMFSKIAEVNTENVAPLIHMSPAVDQWREDSALNTLKIEAIKSNAPKMVGDFFAVPKVIE